MGDIDAAVFLEAAAIKHEAQNLSGSTPDPNFALLLCDIFLPCFVLPFFVNFLPGSSVHVLSWSVCTCVHPGRLSRAGSSFECLKHPGFGRFLVRALWLMVAPPPPSFVEGARLHPLNYRIPQKGRPFFGALANAARR